MKNKKLFAILTLVCFMFTLMPVAAMAEGSNVTAITISASGGQTTTYSSLDFAFDAVQTGETIQIPAGSYTLEKASYSLPESVSIIGETDTDGNNLVTITSPLGLTANKVTVRNINVNTSENALKISGNGTFENCNLTGNNGTRYCYANNGNVTFNNCTITGSTYGVHFDGGNGEGNVIIENCQITGWTSFGTAVETVKISDTNFVDGNYNLLRFYQNAEISSCTFPANGGYEEYAGTGMRIDTGSNGAGKDDITITFTDCSEEVVNMLPGVVTDVTSVVINGESYVVPVAKNGATEYSSLNEAIAQGGTVTLLRDVKMTDTVTVPADLTVTLDLGGYTLNGYIYTENNCNLTVTNGAIINTDSDYSGIEVQQGTLTLTDVDITSARHAVRIDGAVTATINGGTYKVENKDGKTTHAVNVSGAAQVTINDGIFTGAKGTGADSGSAVNVQAGATVAITGGNFSGGLNNTLAAKGDLNISGGTFDQAVAEEYCADNFEPKQNNDGTYGVEVAAASSLSGEGTEKSPYIINNLADLKYFRNEVNSGNGYADQFIQLGSDIDMDGITWTPIGNGSREGSSYTGNAFNGTFNGNNRTISNLSIIEGETVGLFGIVDGGTVKNLTLQEVAINAATGDNVGAAIGVMVNNTIADSITVSGTVSGADGVGGVVGRMTVEGTINNCINHAKVTANKTAGGIVGKAYYTDAGKEMIISECVNDADVTGSYAAGGIAGFSAANVTGCANSGNITAGTMAGGIVGEQTNYGEVSANINSGTISNNGSDGTSYGGIIGWVRYQDNANYNNSEVIAVSGNTNTGTISANGASLGAGGIVGSIYNQASVTDNLNTSKGITGGTFAAGIAGNLQNSDENKKIDGGTILVTGNTTTTLLDAITGKCKDYVAYNNESGRFTVKDNIYGVAVVNNVGYATLAEAVEAAEAGNTIKLLTDIETDTIIVDKNLTIVSDGHTLNGTIKLANGAILTAGEGLAVETDVKGSIVTYKNGAYSIVKVYTVTFIDGDDVITQEIAAGATVTTPDNPKKDGYTFAGWYTSEDSGVTLHDKAYDFTAAVTKDVTLYAKWTAIETETPVAPSTSSSGGGFSGKYNYPVTIADTVGADVTADQNYAVAGETVTITVDPDAGKQVAEVIVTDADGDVIPVTKVGDNKYSFTMPAGKVNVSVTTEAADYDLRIVMQINNKNIVVNNRTFTNDVAPVIVGDRTLVPVRIVTELLGGTADWDNATRTVTLTIDGKVLKLVIDQPIPGFGTSATIINNRTYVPIRYVAEKLGANVEWIAATQQIIIEK